jgi:hypothetical protein
MNPVLENTLIAGSILAALGYLLSRVTRGRRAKKACESGCGCAPAAKLARPERK